MNDRMNMNVTNYRMTIGQGENMNNMVGLFIQDKIQGWLSTFSKAFVHLADSFIPLMVEATFGSSLQNKSYEELAPEFEKHRRMVEFIMKDPQTRQALHDVLSTYLLFIKEVYDLSQPELNDLVDRFWETLNEVAHKSGVGVTNTAMNFVSSAIAEIPVAGGMIDLVLSILRGFNQFMVATSPLVKQSIHTAGRTKALVNELQNTYDKTSPQLERSLNTFTQALQSLDNISGKYPVKSFPRDRDRDPLTLTSGKSHLPVKSMTVRGGRNNHNHKYNKHKKRRQPTKKSKSSHIRRRRTRKYKRHTHKHKHTHSTRNRKH
jgi:hypothetical protein